MTCRNSISLSHASPRITQNLEMFIIPCVPLRLTDSSSAHVIESEYQQAELQGYWCTTAGAD